MENFVRDYGTGNAVPDPPLFIDYSSPDAQPASSQRPTTHVSNFARQTQRQRQATSPLQNSQPEPEPEPPVDMTGVGAAAQVSPPQRTGAPSRSSTRGQEPMQQVNGLNGRATPNVGTRPADPQADPIHPTAATMLKVGPNAYAVDLDRDPQAGIPSVSSNAASTNVGQDDDPLRRQMNELRNTAGGGSVRHSGQWKPAQAQQSAPGGSGLSPPPGTTQHKRDYRNSAEIVVGSYPPVGQPAASRPTSPNITNVHMRPPSQNGFTGPNSAVSVENVVADYQQSLPGERKSISRPPSRANSISVPQGSSVRGRPLSSESGHAGIGAQGRSTSPFQPLPRSTSPAMQGQLASNRNSFTRPPPTGPPPGAGHAHSGSNVRQGSISIPPLPSHQQRPTSPGIGIQLDRDGRVVTDDMAAIYRPTPQQLPAQTQPPFGAPPPVPGAQQQVQRRPSYNPGPNGAPYPGGQQYGGAGQAPVYNPPPQQYPPPVQQPQQPYGAPPAQPGGFSQGYQQQPVYGQPQPGGALVPRGPSVSYPQQPPQQPTQALQQPPQQQQYRAPSPRAPSPQPPGGQPPPTGQYTDDGRGVLFYGMLAFSLVLFSALTMYPAVQSRRCTTTGRRSTRSSTSRRATSSPLPLPPKTDGGAVSCSTRPGGNRDGISSRATSCASSEQGRRLRFSRPGQSVRYFVPARSPSRWCILGLLSMFLVDPRQPLAMHALIILFRSVCALTAL